MSPIALPIAELLPALTGLGKVLRKRPTLPILGMIKIQRAPDGWITLTATDLDTTVSVRLEQPTAGEPLGLLVPCDELLKLTKTCPKTDTLLVSGRSLNTAAILYAIGQQVAETVVDSFPVEEFPVERAVDVEAVALPQAVRAALHDALDCASTDETRLIINGAFIDVSKPDAHYVVGTDGRHLFSSNSFSLPLKHSVLIPNHKFLSWKEFNTDGEWQMKAGVPEAKDQTPPPLEISSRRWRFTTRQIEGNYPNWRQAIPGAKQFGTKVELDPEALEKIIPIIQRMPCDDGVNIAIGLECRDGKLRLLGRSSKDAPFTAVPIEDAKVQGGNNRVFLNRQFLVKALHFGLATIEIIDAMSPVRLSHGGRQMIVMPTRPDQSPAPASTTPPPTPTPAASQNEPTAHNPPPQPAEQPKETTPMPEQNGNTTTGAKRATTTTTTPAEEPKPALDTALAQLEVVRGDFRNSIAGLNKLGALLRQVQRESKASDKEISSVRQTLRSLQSVRI